MSEINPLVDETGSLKEDIKEKIKKHATNVECECPTHLMLIADAINKFQIYETDCLITDLKQREIHEWLLAESQKMELMISETIIGLMQKEGFIDSDYNFLTPPNTEGL